MSGFSVPQLLLDAQKMANRIRDLDNLSALLLVEAQGNNKMVESLRLFQDDLDILSRLSHNKTNADIVNRIQQQNACSSEIIKENRELKVCLEDYEKALEIIMKKYREHTASNILSAKINFKDGYNEGLWRIIYQQREKINEMATVMKEAASVDENAVIGELESLSKLKLENKTLRELLSISKQYGSANFPTQPLSNLKQEKEVQTDFSEEITPDHINVCQSHMPNILETGATVPAAPLSNETTLTS